MFTTNFTTDSTFDLPTPQYVQLIEPFLLDSLLATVSAADTSSATECRISPSATTYLLGAAHGISDVCDNKAISDFIHTWFAVVINSI